MPNSRQTSAMASPSRSRATKRRRSSITELAFHGIHTSRRTKAESVTHVSGTFCHLCLGPLIADTSAPISAAKRPFMRTSYSSPIVVRHLFREDYLNVSRRTLRLKVEQTTCSDHKTDNRSDYKPCRFSHFASKPRHFWRTIPWPPPGAWSPPGGFPFCGRVSFARGRSREQIA